MPIFDFECSKCETIREDVVLRVSQDIVENHPKCEGCDETMVKKPSRTSSHFRGRGFHATDYRAPTRGY